jgi:hypothetical protein
MCYQWLIAHQAIYFDSMHASGMLPTPKRRPCYVGKNWIVCSQDCWFVCYLGKVAHHQSIFRHVVVCMVVWLVVVGWVGLGTL